MGTGKATISLYLTFLESLKGKKMSEMETATQIADENVINVRSVVLTEKGSFDKVKVIDWPLATTCKSNEVRVSVEYCGVNFADVYHIQGKLLQCPVPYVLGLECAGKIIELGQDVEDLNVGDRVVCYKPQTGLFRETVIVARSQCFKVPHDICNKIACSLVANYLTAYFSLFEFANLRPGHTVLIHSAAGGVGWAATQLARSVSNVRVFGTASVNKHADIHNNGVSTPLTYDEYTTHISHAEVDIVIDNIGGENIKKSLALLRPFGRVVLTGANCVVQEDESKVAEAMQSLGSCTVPMQELVMGNKSVCGLHLGTLLQDSPLMVHRAVQHIFSLCQQGTIEPRVHTVLPFSKAVEAIKALADRKNIGKVLLKVE